MLAGILVFANWAQPQAPVGFWYALYQAKWSVTGLLGLALSPILIVWFQLPRGKVLLVTGITLVLALRFWQTPLIPFSAGVLGLSWLTSTDKNEAGEWFAASWDFAKQILPLLLLGILVAGVLLGRPDQEGLIPAAWVTSAVGENSLLSNFVAAFAGALMYFATLTEIPILQGLIGSGMGQGPALALLLAGPALSLPNILVIRSVMGTQKTIVFTSLVVVMATLAGLIYGTFFG